MLVIGGDSGTNRDASLGLRADAVMMASIDTHTGAALALALAQASRVGASHRGRAVRKRGMEVSSDHGVDVHAP